jgi:hypothetical protein
LASIPNRLVRLNSEIFKDEEVYGQRDRDRYDDYKYLVPKEAKPKIDQNYAQFSQE